MAVLQLTLIKHILRYLLGARQDPEVNQAWLLTSGIFEVVWEIIPLGNRTYRVTCVALPRAGGADTLLRTLYHQGPKVEIHPLV